MKKIKLIYIGYVISLVALALYSFAHTDPNLTLLNSSLWAQFRDVMVNFGFLNRPDSWITYLTIALSLSIFHILLLKHAEEVNPLKLGLISGVILLFSYPFASTDLFNYIFDAKILTHYHMNPYQHVPNEFSADPWLRFMRWTHRTYPYGPTFLPVTLIPSFFGFNIFLITFVLFKAMFAGFYFGCVHILNKMNRKWAVFFASQPFLLIEGVVNAHNDLIAIYFALVGIYLLSSTQKAHQVYARLLFLASAGIKFFTLPALILIKKEDTSAKSYINGLSLIGMTVLLGIASYSGSLQQWYFMNGLIFIPYYFLWISKLQLFSLGLILSYYPIIRHGKWEPTPGVNIKDIIIFSSLSINIIVIFFVDIFKKRS